MTAYRLGAYTLRIVAYLLPVIGIRSDMILSECPVGGSWRMWVIEFIVMKPTPDDLGLSEGFPDQKRVYPAVRSMSCPFPGSLVSLIAAMSIFSFARLGAM